VENPYETVLYAVSQKWIGISRLTFKHSGYYIYMYVYNTVTIFHV
jgi:hypothetical protein